MLRQTPRRHCVTRRDQHFAADAPSASRPWAERSELLAADVVVEPTVKLRPVQLGIADLTGSCACLASFKITAVEGVQFLETSLQAHELLFHFSGSE